MAGSLKIEKIENRKWRKRRNRNTIFITGIKFFYQINNNISMLYIL